MRVICCLFRRAKFALSVPVVAGECWRQGEGGLQHHVCVGGHATAMLRTGASRVATQMRKQASVQKLAPLRYCIPAPASYVNRHYTLSAKSAAGIVFLAQTRARPFGRRACLDLHPPPIRHLLLRASSPISRPYLAHIVCTHRPSDTCFCAHHRPGRVAHRSLSSYRTVCCLIPASSPVSLTSTA